MPSLTEVIFPFGLIQTLSGMHNHKEGKQGRNQTYSDTAIQCCLMIKSLFRLSLRMVTGFVQSLIKLCGLNWTAPDYSTLCRRQKHIDIAISYLLCCIDIQKLSFPNLFKFK